MRSPFTQRPLLDADSSPIEQGPAERLKRPKLDAKAVQRSEIGRLRALRVKIVEIAKARSQGLFERFAREFVDPERTARYLDEVRRASERDAGIDHSRWLRPDCTAAESGRGCLQWLSGGQPGARCVRFDRRVRLPTFEIALDTMEDAWAASWPGLYVRFDLGRALAVSLDYETLRCDLRSLRSSPYR